MTTRLGFLTASLTFLACSTSGPREGEWTVSAVSIDVNECNADEEDLDPGSTFNIRDEGDDMFTVGAEDIDPISCTVDGDEFTCDPLVEAESFGPATGEFSSTITGTLDGRDNASVVQAASLDCEGMGCAAASLATGISFPCAIETSFEIEWISDDLGVLAEE